MKIIKPDGHDLVAHQLDVSCEHEHLLFSSRVGDMGLVFESSSRRLRIWIAWPADWPIEKDFYKTAYKNRRGR